MHRLRDPALHTPLLLVSVVLWILCTIDAPAREAVDFSFTETAKAAGLSQFTVYGGTRTNRYLLETTGCGVAVLDYRWRRMAGRVSRERHDARRVPHIAKPLCAISIEIAATARSRTSRRAPGSDRRGWGQGACAGDYDNDGRDDLFVTIVGQNRLYRNRGDGSVRGRDRPRRTVER